MKEVKSYNQLRAELDEALAWFDNDNIDVDEAIERYRLAIKLTKEIQEHLKSAKNTVEKLTKNV